MVLGEFILDINSLVLKKNTNWGYCLKSFQNEMFVKDIPKITTK
jgi:hypothetical protein